MIKLIKEFLLSGIEANKAISEAMNASVKSNKKAVEYYDTIIYNDNLRTHPLQPQSTNLTTPNKVPYALICSCNPANGGSGICGCVIGDKMVDVNISSITSASTTNFNTSK